jgi:hypothetical protein
MLPFHESLLWFDARKSGAAGARWAVRKVNMRGTGITLARILLDPPATLALSTEATNAVEGIKHALQAPSPFAALAAGLQAAVPEDDAGRPEPAETVAWNAASAPALDTLARRIIRHAQNIMSDSSTSPPARMLKLRSILALDVAVHMLERSWEASETPSDQRYLLLNYAPEERRNNRVRVASEASYQSARQSIVQALIATVARRASELANRGAELSEQFEVRSGLDGVAEEMRLLGTANATAFGPLAGRVYEEARGGGYGRPADAFRVLLDSIQLLTGTGSWRWLRAGPELLGAMIGAAGEAPMEAPRFLTLMRTEWNLVIGEGEAIGTSIENVLDGGHLNRNARHLERLLVASGLAQSLSDQTCMVGQRLREAA